MNVRLVLLLGSLCMGSVYVQGSSYFINRDLESAIARSDRAAVERLLDSYSFRDLSRYEKEAMLERLAHKARGKYHNLLSREVATYSPSYTSSSCSPSYRYFSTIAVPCAACSWYSSSVKSCHCAANVTSSTVTHSYATQDVVPYKKRSSVSENEPMSGKTMILMAAGIVAGAIVISWLASHAGNVSSTSQVDAARSIVQLLEGRLRDLRR